MESFLVANEPSRRQSMRDTFDAITARSVRDIWVPAMQHSTWTGY